MVYIEWQFSCFLKGQILRFSTIVIFAVSGILRHVFEGMPKKCRDHVYHIGRQTKELSNFKSNLTSLRFFMKNFTLNYSKNNDFLLVFLSFVLSGKKRRFPRFSVFSVLYSISVIFLSFPYRGKLATLG